MDLLTIVFDVLGLSRSEDQNDHMLEWLCNPHAARSHGISNFAALIISELWGIAFDEPVVHVKRQYKLAGDCWPDLAVEFQRSLLIIENKVKSSALKEGQLGRQQQLGLERQAGKPFFHVLLCPDRSRHIAELHKPTEASETFRILTYRQLAVLIRSAADHTRDDQARLILSCYAAFLEKSLGKTLPIRPASLETIARRNASLAWSEQEFMNRAAGHGEQVQQLQADLLDLLKSMEVAEVCFDSRGPANATYKVCLVGTEIHPLLVYEDGRLYVRWGQLDKLFGRELAEFYRNMWLGRVKVDNKDGAYVEGGLPAVDIDGIATKLQALADAVAGRSS